MSFWSEVENEKEVIKRQYPDLDVDKAIAHFEAKNNDYSGIGNPVGYFKKMLTSNQMKFTKSRRVVRKNEQTTNAVQNFIQENNPKIKETYESWKTKNKPLKENYIIVGGGIDEEKEIISEIISSEKNIKVMSQETEVFYLTYKDFNIDLEKVINAFLDNLNLYRFKPVSVAFHESLVYQLKKASKDLEPTKKTIQELKELGFKIYEASKT